MLKEALVKIQAEVAAAPNNRTVAVIAGFLMNHIRSNPEHAALIMTDGKTIAGSSQAMEDEAKRQQTNVLSDEEGFAIVLRYYGVAVPEAIPAPAAAPKFDVSLEDLM